VHFSTANGAELFTADVMFICIFTKNDIGLTHRVITHIYGHQYEYERIHTVSYGGMHPTSNVKVKDTCSHHTTFGHETDKRISDNILQTIKPKQQQTSPSKKVT